MSGERIPRAGLVLLALIAVGWGVNWPIIKVVIGEIPPLIFRGLSLVLAALGMFAILRASRLPLAVPAGRWPRLLWLSAFNITGWNVFLVYGIGMLPSGRAAILGYTMPLWSVLLSVALLHEPLGRRRLAGLALGLAGMILLASGEIAALGRAPLGVLLMLAAAVSWACGVVGYKHDPLPMPIATLTAWQMLLGGAPMLAAGLVLERVDWLGLSFWPAFGFAYNVFVALLLCYWAWNKLVQMLPVAVSSLGSLIVPVVGVFSGMAFLGEVPRWQDYAALLLVLAAVATVIVPQRR